MKNTIVIFGASGDLTSRKLIPALYALFRKDRLPAETKIVGVSRTEFSHDQWREQLHDSTKEFSKETFDAETWRAFADRVYYHPGDIGEQASFQALGEFLDELESGDASSRVYYLSTMPKLYPVAAMGLGQAGLADESNGPRRIVVEKPFGSDLASAQALNQKLHSAFDEKQVYRIDHYLGKETVQNLFVLRFANLIFEPLWNRNFIDNVQITVAEEVPVGSRAGYYDGSGVLRDMFQNHLLQLLMITAMEAPPRFEANLVRDEKVKVLQAVRPLTGSDFANDTRRGRYQGYLNEEGVPADSQTATFAALKLHIDNWRWNGVPFYLRSGKAMSCRTTQIVIQFRKPPLSLFGNAQPRGAASNQLVIQIQPAEGLFLEFLTKVPDAGMRLCATNLEFQFAREFHGEMPDAYQRLLLDVLKGDPSLFARSDEVELAWKIVDPILAAWDSPAAPPLDEYEIGLWGPEAVRQWMFDQGREWFDVCPVLH
ncbi:MAG: glucose-6-phosphate dehydrogenase [bacterium]|nr:glucose-6-phosphate dehydrogenase [bacterium]